MSDLLIDIGNTRLKWALLTDGHISKPASLMIEEAEPARLRQLVTESLSQRIFVSNVSGAAIEQRLSQACADMGWPAPVYIRSQASAFGLVNAYSQPEKLGVDRWLAMIAAYHKYRKAFYLVDAGSAVTIDSVDQEGKHRGGIIAPGYTNMLATLVNETALTIDRTGVPGELLLERSNGNAMLSGCAVSVVGLINQFVSADDLLVLTGGDAAWVSQLLNRECEISHGLVLEGLAQYAEGE